MIRIAVISDRPSDLYLEGCIESLRNAIPENHGDTLCRTIYDHDHTLGMAGAVQAAWSWALDWGAEYLLHVEEDFRFHELPLDGMLAVLEANPHLAQVVLKRQPWSSEEHAAGGIIELDPAAYTQRDGFVESRKLFSLNPSLIPRRVLELGWPSGPLGVGNETGFTAKCLAAGYSFGMYGRIEDPPRVEHVGLMRGNGWRL